MSFTARSMFIFYFIFFLPPKLSTESFPTEFFTPWSVWSICLSGHKRFFDFCSSWFLNFTVFWTFLQVIEGCCKVNSSWLWSTDHLLFGNSAVERNTNAVPRMVFLSLLCLEATEATFVWVFSDSFPYDSHWLTLHSSSLCVDSVWHGWAGQMGTFSHHWRNAALFTSCSH